MTLKQSIKGVNTISYRLCDVFCCSRFLLLLFFVGFFCLLLFVLTEMSTESVFLFWSIL